MTTEVYDNRFLPEGLLLTESRACRLSSDEILFGTDKGLLSMKPEIRQNDESSTRVNDSALGDDDLRDGAVTRSHDLIFHLHGLEHDQHITGLDCLALRDVDLEDVAGHRSGDNFAGCGDSSGSGSRSCCGRMTSMVLRSSHWQVLPMHLKLLARRKRMSML